MKELRDGGKLKFLDGLDYDSPWENRTISLKHPRAGWPGKKSITTVDSHAPVQHENSDSAFCWMSPRFLSLAARFRFFFASNPLRDIFLRLLSGRGTQKSDKRHRNNCLILGRGGEWREEAETVEQYAWQHQRATVAIVSSTAGAFDQIN
jgi:hypothetical protein